MMNSCQPNKRTNKKTKTRKRILQTEENAKMRETGGCSEIPSSTWLWIQ